MAKVAAKEVAKSVKLFLGAIGASMMSSKVNAEPL